MEGGTIDVDGQSALGDSEIRDGDWRHTVGRGNGDLPLRMETVLLEQPEEFQF